MIGPRKDSTSATEFQASNYEWTTSFPLLTNRFLLWDAFKVLAISGASLFLLTALLCLFTANLDALPGLALLTGCSVLGLGFLFLAVMLVFFGNRFKARFTLTPNGVFYQALSRRARFGNRAAIVAGVLTGSPQAVGAGLLAASQEADGYNWSDFHTIREYPSHCILSLCNHWRCVVRLFCTPENYEEVRGLVREYSPQAVVKQPRIDTWIPAARLTPPGVSVGLMEPVRRLALAAGVAVFAWLLLDTPRFLYSVRVVDFEEEYAAKYGEPVGRPIPGAISLGREVIRRTTNPGSAAAYRERTLEGRLIRSEWPNGPRLAEAAAQREVWLMEHDPDLAPLLPALEASYRSGANWLNAYLAVPTPAGTRYLEFLRHNDPKDSHAPRALVYPGARVSWRWLGAAILLYTLLPARGLAPPAVGRDPVAIAALDVAAAIFAGLFFALPLAFHASTAEALADRGVTGFCWTVSAAIACLLLYNGWLAAFRVTPTDTGLRVASALGEREISFCDIQSIEPLARGDERIGLTLRLHNGAREEIDWTGLVNSQEIMRRFRVTT